MSLGLSSYEATVYEALIRVRKARVQELAKMTPVPRPQIYVALGKLMDKGLANEGRGRVSSYSVVPPEVAFEDILRGEEQALAGKVEGVRRLGEVFGMEDKDEVPYDFIEVLKGRQVRRSITELTQGAEEEVLVFFKQAEERGDAELDDAAGEETAVLAKRVKVRCLYERSVLRNAKVVSLLRKLVKRGEKGRVVPSLPMNMLIVDGRVATFSLIRPEGDVTVFVFRHPALVATMKAGFERFWHRGKGLAGILSKLKEEK